MTQPIVTKTQPTFYFIGVTTGKSPFADFRNDGGARRPRWCWKVDLRS